VVKTTVEQFKKEIIKQKIAPAYFFYGEEIFSIEHLTKILIKKAIEPGTEDFNIDILYGNEVDGARVINAAMAYPMMAPRRMVVVKNIHNMGQNHLSLVEKYVNHPSLTTCLLLTSEKADIKKSIFQKIMQKCVVVEARSLYDNEIPAWIRSYLEERGYTIADEALRLLHAYVGKSLKEISSEIEKIFVNLINKKHIEIKDVENVVGSLRHFNIFDLCDAIGGKNVKKSIYILNQMIQMGETPTAIVAMIYRHFSILIKIKELLLRKTKNNEIAGILNLRPSFINNYILQSKNFSNEQLQSAFLYLLEADESLKTSYQKSRLTLELLVFKILSR
jgi:DNA polymerase III subunit delta